MISDRKIDMLCHVNSIYTNAYKVIFDLQILINHNSEDEKNIYKITSERCWDNQIKTSIHYYKQPHNGFFSKLFN